MSAAYLRKGKVKPGTGIAGWITLRKPSGGKLEVRPTDMLGRGRHTGEWSLVSLLAELGRRIWPAES
jgi:hypothetical protein